MNYSTKSLKTHSALTPMPVRIRRNSGIHFGLLLVLMTIPSLSQSRLQSPLRTTLCSIVKSPAKFDHKLVSFTAQYDGDGIERVVLIDKACGGLGIDPWYTPNSVRGMEALDSAIRQDHWGFRGKVITATFIGRFRLHDGRRPARILMLHEVRDVKCDIIDSELPPPPIKLPET
jgi:hypothetical protein